jgi:NADH-quinone oxidoreductase subunit L
MTHAFFKALLFLGSGSVIHAMHHEQDMQKMGGLIKHMPITGWTFVVGALAISGFPLFFAGFFSKDEILWNVFASPLGHPLLWVVGAATAVLTAFYMFRAVALTFFGASRVDPHLAHHVHESPWPITVPLLVLAGLSIVGGWVGIPHVLGAPLGIPHALEHYFDGFFATLPAETAHHAASTELLLMGASVVAALAAMWVAYTLFSRNLERVRVWRDAVRPVYVLLSNKYWIDELYNAVVVRPIHWLSDAVLWRIVDVRLIDGLVNGVGISARNLGGALRLAHNGVVQNYAVGVVVGAVLIFWWLLF